MLFFAGARWGYFLQLSAGTLPALCYFAVFQVAYRRDRMLAFLDPMNAEGPAGYHLRQSFIAIGSGGMSGVGLGQSHAKMAFLPEKHTDFIFAALSEELGFVGAAAVLLLYAGVIFMALRIASTSHSHFGRLGSAGVTATFALYVLINGAMVMGMAPVVGVPMPLLSYGGTVMLTVMIGFGLVLSTRVHRYSEVTSGRGSLL